MRLRIALAAMLLPLAGCVAQPPPGPGPYGQPGYPPPGYPPPGYPPGPYGQQDLAYPGYAYNNGSPTLFVDGVIWPLIFYGGGWGYWDGYNRWHGAPGPVGLWLSARHPGGVGYRPYGGGPWGRPGGWGGRAYGPAGGVRPAVGPGGYRPAGGGGGGGAARPAPARQAPQRQHEEHH